MNAIRREGIGPTLAEENISGGIGMESINAQRVGIQHPTSKKRRVLINEMIVRAIARNIGFEPGIKSYDLRIPIRCIDRIDQQAIGNRRYGPYKDARMGTIRSEPAKDVRHIGFARKITVGSEMTLINIIDSTHQENHIGNDLAAPGATTTCKPIATHIIRAAMRKRNRASCPRNICPEIAQRVGSIAVMSGIPCGDQLRRGILRLT